MEEDKEFQMSIKDIENNLKEILNQSEETVCVIKGKWGVGKTHFIRNFLNNFGQRYAYISLFGKDSLNIIENEIVFKIAKFRKILGDVSRVLQQLEGVSSKAGAIGNLLSLVSTTDIKNAIVVIDDFERLSSCLEPKDIMGLIAQLKEDKRCKIIFILNEEILLDKYKHFKKEYDEYKEKIVDFEFTYEPTVEENFELIKNRFKCFHEEAKEFFVVNDIKNIRSMLQVSYLINKLCNIDVDRNLLKESVRYLLPFIYLKKAKNKDTKTIKEIIREFNIYLKNKDLSKESKDVIDLFNHLKKIDFLFISFYPEFIYPFFEYIDTELLTDDITEEIRIKFDEELNRRKNLAIKYQFEEEFERYVYSIEYEDKDFIEKIWKPFEQYKQDILSIFSISDLYGWMIEILSVMDKENSNRYKDYFADVITSYLDKIYIEDKEEFKRIIKIERFGLYSLKNMAEKVPKLKKYIDTKEKEVESLTVNSCDGLKELMLCILKMDCPSTEGEKLNELDFRQIEQCIKNPEFLKILLSFIRHERKTSKKSVEKFIEKFDKFLEDFEKERPEIKEKIEIWKLRSR